MNLVSRQAAIGAFTAAALMLGASAGPIEVVAGCKPKLASKWKRLPAPGRLCTSNRPPMRATR